MVSNDVINILEEHRGIRVVSFDVFDTLLFRTCIKPADVFARMYQKKRELFPEHVKEEDWVNARQTAERKARRSAFELYGNYEVTLDDIYAELSPKLFRIEDLKVLELQCEEESCFLNPEIYKLLVYIREKYACKVILCSDMYLNSDQISGILSHNGFDRTLAHRIYVSSEHKKSKRYMSLYHTVLSDLQILPEEMLHVGDNYYSDAGVPHYMGIHSYHYDRISNAVYQFPFLTLESEMNSSLCKEIFPLRLMASAGYGNTVEMDEEDRFWFDQGAMIYGPFMTYGAEWILDTAEQNNISIIRPLMREGAFLTELLKNAAEHRVKKFDIEPLYISRFAVFTSLFGTITAKEIEYLAGTYNLYVKDFFEILKIEDQIGEYGQYSDQAVSDLREVSGGEESMYELLIEYLETPEMMDMIRGRNQGNAKTILEYLSKMRMNEKSITVDVGWRGSIQSAIDRLLEKEGILPDIMHLLLVCNPTAGNNVTEGCDIRGFVGNYGSCADIFGELSARIMELAFFCDEGTTVDYAVCGGEIRPVTRPVKYPSWQVSAMKQLQRGIVSFHNVYYSMSEQKPFLREMVQNSEGLCQIIGRLHSFPLAEEVKRMKNLEYDQNFGANTFTKILSDEMIEKYRKSSTLQFYGKYRGRGVYWYSGLNVAAKDALFYCEQNAFAKRRYAMLSMICLTRRILQEKGSRGIVLVQAGAMTRLVLCFLAAAGEMGCVLGIVDNDEMIHGVSMGGIKIYPVDHDFKDPLYVFTTIRKEVYLSIYRQLCRHKGTKPTSIGYFEDRI
ncbi:MAG: hypothetical protein HFH15_11815 [Ruminococcus sp.]|nr:hypothetical protein [Ruminococcus sp.]